MTIARTSSRAGASLIRTVPPWQRELAQAVSSAGELLDLLGLPEDVLGGEAEAREAARQFPLRVPRGFVARMRPGDPRDPLLLQVLPTAAETAPAPAFTRDPLQETVGEAAPGVLHKYRGRALVMVTGACGVHCRYCFRRHFPYGETVPGRFDWGATLDYLRGHTDLREVILSGGDPLAASDARLGELAGHLAGIPHLRRLRIHSRMPVVLPERVDENLLAWLGKTPLKTVVVLHANHAHEVGGTLGASLGAAVGRLKDAGVTVLNQAVLLKGVNDSVEALEDLSETLFEAGVLPYYLHLLDRVQGAAHFEVPEDRARALAAELAGRLPGYLVPRLVREVPGAAAKVPVDLEGLLGAS